MRKIIFSLLFTATLFCEEIDVAKISEAIGHLIGKNLDELGVDLDLDALVDGLKAESEGENCPLNEAECLQRISDLQEQKISSILKIQLERADAISNGNQLQKDENYPFSASNPAKHR